MLCFRYFMQIVVSLLGEPLIKRFALGPLSCLSCLSLTLAYCGQTVGWIKVKLGMKVGLVPDHIVLCGDPAPPPQKKMGHNPQFSAHVCSNQTAGWIKIPLGREVGLGSGDIVLDGDPASASKSGAAPTFWPMCIVSKRSPISAIAELLFLNCCRNALLCVVSCCWRAVCRVWNNAKTSQSQLSKVLQTWFRWLYHIC